MQNANDGGKRYTDPSEGLIYKAILADRKPLPKSDPRMDILIDLGVLLAGESRQYFIHDKMELARIEGKDYIGYFITVDDGIVFDVCYNAKGMQYGEYMAGPWETQLAIHAKMMRQTRRLLAEVLSG